MPDDVLPDLLAHMWENAHIEHPHRLETDLGAHLGQRQDLGFAHG